MISNTSSRLEKNTKPPNFAYECFFFVFFMNVFKKSSFFTFSYIFENNQLHILISLFVF